MDANKAIKQKKAQKDDDAQTVTVRNLYSMDVPSFLSPTDKLGEDASLQYWNKTLDISVQVVEEPKQDFLDAMSEYDMSKDNTILENMAAVVLTSLFEDMSKVELANRNSCQINGMNALTLNAFQKRTFFKDALYASLAFVEGKNTLYQIVILSGGTSIAKLADKLEQMIYSFKEL